MTGAREHLGAVDDVVCLDVSAMDRAAAIAACAARVAAGAVVIARVAPGDDVTRAACLRIGCYHAVDADVAPPILSGVLGAATAAAQRNREDIRHVALRAVRRGAFELRTPEDATAVALLLSEVMPDPARAALGLAELMVNAVEHGNLEIGSRTKSELLQRGDLSGEIARRLALPELRDRRARVVLDRADRAITIRIRDDGPGFDWTPWTDGDVEASTALHGRGIALVHALHFASVEYRAPGNLVVVTAEAPW